MKLKLRQIQEKTKDIQIFGSLINKWIYQRNELNQKRKEIFDKLYGENNDKYYDENYPKIEENINKKSYHKTFEEKLELIKNEIEIKDNEENQNKRALYNNSDNIKQIFNQIDEKNEEKKENVLDNKIDENIKIENNENISLNKEIKENKENEIKEKEKEEEKKNLDKKNDKENNDDINIKEKEKEKIIKNENKNKYLQSINLFPEKGIQEEIDTLYQLSILIKSEEKENNISQDINKETKNKQIPIQLIIKEFFYDIILKQNSITNQTFVLMLKNKFGLMHHFDFFNSIILCKKGNIILQYIETIFDFKTLTLKTSDPEYLTNELKSLVKSDYNNNIKSLYLNDLLESLKFKRISELNLDYAINNFELNFKLEYMGTPPIDIIFNNSNSDIYDKIFKKLLKYNIYNQINVKIYQI